MKPGEAYRGEAKMSRRRVNPALACGVAVLGAFYHTFLIVPVPE
jgi:hypothetical protein